MSRHTETMYHAVQILRSMALAKFALGQQQAFQALSEAADVIGHEADMEVQRRSESEARDGLVTLQ